MPHQGVAALVVGDGVLGLLVEHAALALRTGDDALHGLAHLALRDDLLATARREQRPLVHEVRQIGAREARRELGHLGEVHVAADGLVLAVHLQDLLAALHVGRVHHDLAVEAAGAQQGGVEHVGAVRGGDRHTGRCSPKPSISTSSWLSVCSRSSWPPPGSVAARRPPRVDLVDEDDGREQRPWPAGTGRARGAPTPTNISTSQAGC